MQEWDQQRVDSRTVIKMRRIAQDAMDLIENGTDLDDYAEQHKLTVNEVVYYLNAYEAGEEEGLYALRRPDIIPVEVANQARRAIAEMVEERAPGLAYRTTDEGTAIGMYEVRRRQNGDQFLFASFLLRRTAASDHWHLYWKRSFGAWWPHSLPKRGPKLTLKARLQQVAEDEFGCFWG